MSREEKGLSLTVKTLLTCAQLCVPCEELPAAEGVLPHGIPRRPQGRNLQRTLLLHRLREAFAGRSLHELGQPRAPSRHQVRLRLQLLEAG